MGSSRDELALECPGCRYDLTGLGEGDCPECGLHNVFKGATVRGGRYRRSLHVFAIVLVVATFILVIAGGTVTSKGAGLAVPDWPSTYGHNMFTYPPSLWVGNIFWEHTHRLMGSLVGILCIAMTICLWHTRGQRPWLCWTGAALLLLVIIQGIMGGLRVTQLSTFLAVVHGVTAQIFLCLTVLIAAATGRTWLAATAGLRHGGGHQPDQPREAGRGTHLRALSVAFAVILLVQLVLGASMRHTGSGLAIPDFPSSLGGVVPPFDEAAIAKAFDRIVRDPDGIDAYPSAAQVGVHFAHRTCAVAVLVVGVWLVTRVARSARGQPSLLRPAGALAMMLAGEALLGAGVVLSARHPEVATAHQTLGAAILATATLLLIRIHLFSGPRRLPDQDRLSTFDL